jgi:hypothetical protein
MCKDALGYICVMMKGVFVSIGVRSGQVEGRLWGICVRIHLLQRPAFLVMIVYGLPVETFVTYSEGN